MDNKLFKELSQQKHTPAHTKLLDHCVHLVGLSRAKMSTFYPEWDRQQDAFNVTRLQDENDAKASSEGRPAKQVLPLTYSKIDTFATFCMTAYKQRTQFFELQAVGEEDEKLKPFGEALLLDDENYNKLTSQIRRMIVNVGKFGVGIMRHSWEKEIAYVPVTKTVGGTDIGGEIFGGDTKVTYEPVTKREGNLIRNVSPYEFFPDTRLPLSDFERGEFCACEREMSKLELRELENQKKVAGVDHINHFPDKTRSSRSETSRFASIKVHDQDTTASITCITEVQVKLIPSRFELADGSKLGDETHQVMYLLWIANDDRVIRCEPMHYLHGQFTYDVAQFNSDEHDYMNGGLGKLLEQLQETIDWFINARVEAVTRTIDNQLIVDPIGVEMSTVINRDRIIKLKKGASRTGVDRYIKQLAVTDTTTNHMADVSQLESVMQQVSGVNDNSLGQYSKGRRSATESRVVTRGASARQLQIADDVFINCLAPLGKKLLSNYRQGLSKEHFDECWSGTFSEELYSLFKADYAKIVKQKDLFIFDGTMPSEKEYLASTLQEILSLVIQNPEAQVQFDISPKLLLNKIVELRGVKGKADYSLQNDPQQMQQIIQQAQQEAYQQGMQMGAQQMQQQLEAQTPNE